MTSYIKNYYKIIKPGIIRGNLMNATAGYLFAAAGNIRPGLYVATMSGLAMIIASGCVFNNFIDRDIDKKMARTKNRATVTGQISGQAAIAGATILGLAGTLIMFVFSNFQSMILALFGLFMYVIVYGIAKRRTVHGTVIGSISGAIPPVVGYSAAAGSLNLGAGLLFLIYVFWQMPHFYAISIYRKKDYAAAKIPVISIVKGNRTAKIHMLAYTIAFTLVAALLSIIGPAGNTFLLVSIIVGAIWFWRGFQAIENNNDSKWAGKMFGFSLIVILLVDITLSLNHWLP